MRDVNGKLPLQLSSIRVAQTATVQNSKYKLKQMIHIVSISQDGVKAEKVMDLFDLSASMFQSAGANGAPYTQQQDAYSAQQQALSGNRTGGDIYYASPGLVASRTASFYDVDKEVSQNILAQTYIEEQDIMLFSNGRPTTPPIGQEDEYLPIGDMLLPMLLCMAGYVIMRNKQHIFKHLLKYAKRK